MRKLSVWTQTKFKRCHVIDCETSLCDITFLSLHPTPSTLGTLPKGPQQRERETTGKNHFLTEFSIPKGDMDLWFLE